QLRHPRQAAGDIAGLGALGRDARDDVARPDLGAGLDRDDGVDGELVTRLRAATEPEDLILLRDHDGRTQLLLIAARAVPPVGHHAFGDTGRLVQRLRHGLAFDQILEPDRALDLGQNRPRVRIPLGDALTALDLGAVLDQQPRTIGDAVGGALGAVG